MNLLTIALGAGAAYLLLSPKNAKADASPSATGPSPTMPEDLLKLYQLAVFASVNPNQIAEVEAILREAGYIYEADVLKGKAQAIREMDFDEWVNFVSCTLRSLGELPGNTVPMPYKGDGADMKNVLVATDEECNALAQEKAA